MSGGRPSVGEVATHSLTRAHEALCGERRCTFGHAGSKLAAPPGGVAQQVSLLLRHVSSQSASKLLIRESYATMSSSRRTDSTTPRPTVNERRASHAAPNGYRMENLIVTHWND